MSRHGYIEASDYDYDGYFAMVRHMGTVARTIRGKRGQKMLRRLADALDAMPDKRLIVEDLVREDGRACGLGAVGLAEGIDLSDVDPEDAEIVASIFDISPTLAREIVWHNDEIVTPPRPTVSGGYYVYADGRRALSYNPWRTPPEGCSLVERVETPPTPEQVEASERQRWQYMRKWVEQNLAPPTEAP